MPDVVPQPSTGALNRPRALLADFLGHEIGRGTAVNLGFAVANSAIALVTGIFAGQALGPAGIGILSLGFLVLEFAGMIDNLGTGGFMRDYAGEARAEKLATVLRLKIALGLGTSLAMVILAPLLAPALDVPMGLLLLFAVIPTTAILSSVGTMVHEARRHPWKRNTPGTVEAVVKFVLYGGFWLAYVGGADVLLFAWGAVAASVVGSVVGAFLVPSLRLVPWDAALAKRYIAFGLAIQASGALSKMIFWGDILVIDLTLGHYTQGLYRTAYQVMAFVPLFAGTVGLFLFPALSEASHRDDMARVRSLFRKSFGYVLAIALPLIVLAVLFAPLVLRLYGPEFEAAAWILRVLAVIAVLPALMVPFEMLLPAMDRPWSIVGITAVITVINLGLDVILIPAMGIIGALIATSTAFVLGLAFAFAATRRYGLFASVPEVRV